MAAGSDANIHGHTQNGTPEARTTTVTMSMRSQAPTRGCTEAEHSAGVDVPALCASRLPKAASQRGYP